MCRTFGSTRFKIMIRKKAVFQVLLATLLLVSASAVGLLSYIYLDIQGRDHVPDEILIENLTSDFAKFEQLITMFREDNPVTVIHPNFMAPDDAISNTRWNAYKRLFEELELDAGMRALKGESIWFISTARGLSIAGSLKGYIFMPENPRPLYQSLNQRPDDLKSGVRGYRKINNEWYISFDESN